MQPRARGTRCIEMACYLIKVERNKILFRSWRETLCIYSLLLPPKGYFSACCACDQYIPLQFCVCWASARCLPGVLCICWSVCLTIRANTCARFNPSKWCNSQYCRSPGSSMGNDRCAFFQRPWRIGRGWSWCPGGRALLALAFIKVFWQP